MAARHQAPSRERGRKKITADVCGRQETTWASDLPRLQRKVQSGLVLEKETEGARLKKDSLCADRRCPLSETSWVTEDNYLTESIPGKKQRAGAGDFRGAQRQKE